MKKKIAKSVMIISLAFNLVFILGFSVAFFLSAITTRDAESTPWTWDPKQPWWENSRLDLSKSQETAFRGTDNELFDTIKEIKEHTSKHCQELLTLISRENVTMAETDAVIDEIGMLQKQAQKLIIQSIIEKRDILSAEQKQRFLDLLKERMCQRCCLQLSLVKDRDEQKYQRCRGGTNPRCYE